MTAFPTGLDVLSNPTPHDNLNSASVLHDEQHANSNDAIEAIEAKVGIDNSGVTNSLDYRVRQLEGAVGSGTARIKNGELQLKDTSGGGTPWHAITLVQVDGIWVIDINQTGVAP